MKPILKWVGGKTQLLEDVIQNFPQECENYYEPFVGGGSILLSILETKRMRIHGKSIASDINPYLIGVYRNIQKDPEKLIKKLGIFSTVTEDTYYILRDLFNTIKDPFSVQASCLFLILNKTCFRGLYREGPKGFNVPYGHYKNPTLFDADSILEMSALIKDVEFHAASFDSILKDATQKDFIYADPPYVNTFSGYTKDGFGEKEHIRLFNMLKSQGNFVMNNSEDPMIHEHFPIEEFKVSTVSCKRQIHSKDPGTKANEVIVRGLSSQ